MLKILKRAYYQNYSTDSNQILHTDSVYTQPFNTQCRTEETKHSHHICHIWRHLVKTLVVIIFSALNP